jgi:hypothetical protein
MPLVCIQCAMRAFLDGRLPPTFDETLEAHMAREHPDPVATKAERQELEKQLAHKLGMLR